MAQLGRAPALGAGGRRFESCRSDHTKCGCNSMVECQPSKLITRVRFPSPAPFFCQNGQTSVPVAQGIEQRTSNPLVGGSIPSWDAKKIKGFHDLREASFLFFPKFFPKTVSGVCIIGQYNKREMLNFLGFLFIMLRQTHYREEIKVAYHHFTIITPKDKNGNTIKDAKKTLRYRPYFLDPVLGEKVQRDFTMQFTGKVQKEHYSYCEKKYEKYLSDRKTKAEKIAKQISFKDTVAAQIYKWLTTDKPNASERHINGCNDVIRLYIEPIIGEMAVTEVTTDDVKKIFTYMSTKEKRGGKIGLSKATQNQAYLLVNGFFQNAEDNNLIPKNPVRAVKKIKLDPPKPESPETVDIQTTLEYMAGHSRNKRNVLTAEIAFVTGMRRQEIAGMTLQNWYPDENVIYMNRTVTNTTSSGKPKAKVGGKTPKAVRNISIPPELTKKIEEYIVGANLKEYEDKYTYIWQDENGKFLNPNDIGNAYRCIKQRLQKKGEVAVGKTGIHSMRHHQGTIMHRAGFHPTDIQKRLGHQSVMTTERYYIAPPSPEKEDDGLGTAMANIIKVTVEKQAARRASKGNCVGDINQES